MALRIDERLRRIRARFPVFENKVYLNSCSQGALSDYVEGGLREYVASWHCHGSPWDLWVEQYEEIRRQFAAFVGADVEEIAILPCVSAGMNSVASACDFAQRPKVVLGELEFPTMGHVWLAQQKRGARVEFVAATNNHIPCGAYDRAIDRHTRLVGVTHICFSNGYRSPIRNIVGKAHEQGAWVFMDDYQDCGTRPINIHELGVDFYVTGTLKYLLGPPGLAFLYVRKELHEQLQPTVTGWFAQANPFAFEVKRLDPAPNARRFEGGSPPIPNIYMAARALALIEEAGRELIAAHVAGLTKHLLDRLAELGLEVKTPPDSVGPLVVIRCPAAAQLCEVLARKDIVVSARHDGLRISLHLYNVREDVEALLSELERNRAFFEPGSKTARGGQPERH